MKPMRGIGFKIEAARSDIVAGQTLSMQRCLLWVIHVV
jgi:hypothetical protein